MAQDSAQIPQQEDLAEKVRGFASRLPSAAEVVIVSGHKTLPLWAHELTSVVAPPANVEIERLAARLRTATAYVESFHETDRELREEQEAHEKLKAELKVCVASADALREERDGLTTQLAAMSDSIAKLEAASVANDDASAQIEAEVAALTAERDELAAEVRRMRDELILNESSLKTLQQQLEEEQRYISELLGRIDSMIATVPTLPPEPPVVPEQPKPEEPTLPPAEPPTHPPRPWEPPPERPEPFHEPTEVPSAPVHDPLPPPIIAGEEETNETMPVSCGGTLADQVFAFVREAGSAGATYVEVANALGILKHTAAARMHYLAKADKVVETGERRGESARGARVFVTLENFVSEA